MFERNFYLRVIAGAATVAGASFVGFRLALEKGHKVDPAVWTLVSWICLGVFGLSVLMAAGFAARFVCEEVRGLRTRVDLMPEDGPGVAQVCVRNRGRSDSFSASARLVEVYESVDNRKFLQTFTPGWVGAGGGQAKIYRGGTDVLRLARSRSDRKEGLHEVELLGWESGAVAKKDFFRWNTGENGPRLILEVSVTAENARASATEQFDLSGLPSGGLKIRRLATPPAVPQAPEALRESPPSI